MKMLVLIIFCAFTCGCHAKTGKFIHVSDFHLEIDYSINGFTDYYCDKYPNGTASPKKPLSKFGNHLCDSSYNLVRSAVQNMAKWAPDAKFIFWTGDSISHDPDEMMNTTKAIKIIQNITDTLNQYFPSTQVYPVLGNHDSYPANQFSGDDQPNAIYNATANMWSMWLGGQHAAAYKSMQTNGYYVTDLIEVKNLKILGLNTNFYMVHGNNAVKIDDPGHQFKFMEQQLMSARQGAYKMWILAHIPPGYGYWGFGNCYNERYLRILREYNDVIAGGFYGHEHTDEFRLISQSVTNNSFINFYLIAPAITPRGNNNPSFRIVDYDLDTAELINIQQIYLDLTVAMQTNEAEWKLEYSYTENYGIDRINTQTLTDLYHLMKANTTYRDMYNTYREASCQRKICNDLCKENNLCEIAFQDQSQYENCLKQPVGIATRVSTQFWFIVVGCTLMYYF